MTNKTLYITQNSPFVQHINLSAPGGTGPLDITNYEPTMFISKYYGSKQVYQVPATIHNGPEGIIRVSISSSNTKLLPSGTMCYSMFVKPPDGDNTIIVNGKVVVISSVYPTVVPEVPEGE